MTTPRPRAVVIGSLALFVVLFVVLTFELSAAASTPAGKTRTAAKARPQEPAAEYVEPETEYLEPEPEYEYAEPEYEYAEPEYEYAEPEVEEIPPVVTSSS
jgi:hypothetical protein